MAHFKSNKTTSCEELVVSGMSGNFPNCSDVKDLLDGLLNKKDFCDEDTRGIVFKYLDLVKLGGRIKDFKMSDMGYYALHPFQAKYMDIGVRLLLEQAVKALFDAGIHPDDIKGSRTGVFIGYCSNDNGTMHFQKVPRNTDLLMGTMRCSFANRISYHLQLNGPSYTLDSACSSSLSALEGAYRAILEGKCDRAIVGGSNICIAPFITYQFAKLGVLNPGTGSRPFDINANGYTRSEAVVAIILEKKSQAKRIYGHLVHAKANDDGFKIQGITFPSFEGQYTLLKDIYEEAAVLKEKVAFLETHGTGTKVGDPEEVKAIDKFFKPTLDKPFLIGSVKANAGHGEGSAGLVSIVKLLTGFNVERIIPNTNFESPRTDIPALIEKRIQVVTEVMEYPEDKPYTGVSSFGFGGANVHTILKKYNKQNNSCENINLRIVCYSGRTQNSVDCIHQEIANCNDVNYLNLLQEDFKKPVEDHLYRGFTIIGSNIKSSMQVTQIKNGEVFLLLNNFEKIKYGEDLMEIPHLKRVIQRLNIEMQLDIDISTKIQILLINLIKSLTTNIKLFVHDDLSKVLSNFFAGQINLKEVIKQLKNQNLKQIVSDNVIKKFIISQSKYGSKSTIIVIGNKKPNLSNYLKQKCNIVHFDDYLNHEKLLNNIGNLHQFGYWQMVHKLYEKPQFPVNSGTNLLSHLCKTKRKEIEFFNFIKETETTSERTYQVWDGENDASLIRGHVIDNKLLYPATGYLYRVWGHLANKLAKDRNELAVVFENIKFHRACTCSNKPLQLHVMLSEYGSFEISQDGAEIVTGSISLYNEKDHDNIIEEKHDKNCYILNNKDVYRELRLRGYNYKGLFRAIEESGPKVSKIKWNDDWITFLDNMLQVAILQEDTRSLMVPIGIKRLVIHANKHVDYTKQKQDNIIPINYCTKTKTISSKFIKIHGLAARSISKKKMVLKPILESYQFIPNEFQTDLSTSIRINIQLLQENKSIKLFKVMELLGNDQEPLMREICKAIEDLPLIIPDITIVTSKENYELEDFKVQEELTKENLLFVCQELNENMIEQAEKSLIKDGFLLCLNTSKVSEVINNSFVLLTTHKLENQKIVSFYRKRISKKKSIICNVSDMEELKWVKELQDEIENHKDVVLFAQNKFTNGILGLTNCLIKEPGKENKVRCVFLQDNCNNMSDVQKQLEKQMTINVFKNGMWGTYRHLVLPGQELLTSQYIYAKTLIPGDLSSIQWIQQAKPLSDKDTYKVEYSCLNFRDLMLASGKLSSEVITTNRFLLDCLEGFEFAGYNYRGEKVIGFGPKSISNFVTNPFLIAKVPDSWKLEEAATLLVVYLTVLYALQKVANIRKGQSILIHSGTGGIGLAALNVCTYYDCNIFVTVGTEEKRNYLLKHYPNLKATQIGNSRDMSFKQMVLRETNFRGVDMVLNSLAEEKLQASVECLAEGGEFLEIGKYDLDKDSDLKAEIVMRGCKFAAIVLDAIIEGSQKNMELLELFYQGVKRGFVKPLPRTIFKMDEVGQAFKYMSTGNHIGKVLIKIESKKEYMALSRFYCNPNQAYIIFGGLGGFGLELADWLILRGAKNIILTSRRGITTGYQQYRIGIWKSYGVNVTIFSEDVTSYQTCYKFIKKINDVTPIDGIFNLALVLKDAIFEHQDIDTMRTSMIPKATLTEHLDKITRTITKHLRYFVVFSSVSCGRGNAGQTNYGFSNSVMERICELRHADGLPALAIQWGAVGDVGILEELQKDNNEIAIGGTLQQKVLNCLEVLDQFMTQNKPIVSSMVVAEKFNKAMANNPSEAVLRILAIKDSKLVDKSKLLSDLGMDSIAAVEIKQVLERDFDMQIEVRDLKRLTFAKLETMSFDEQNMGVDKGLLQQIVLSNIKPRYLLLENQTGIVNFNEEAIKASGQFILAFPGVDGEVKVFEQIAIATKTHIKCVCYDGIGSKQGNFDEVVDYVIQALKSEISKKIHFNILAYSMGSIPAIEFMKKLESLNITGTLIFIDGSPQTVYNLYDKMRSHSEHEYQCNAIMDIVNVIVVLDNLQAFREFIAKGTTLDEKLELSLNYLNVTSLEYREQFKTLTMRLLSRAESIDEYRSRKHDTKLFSKAILYKATEGLVKENTEDYNLNSICNKIHRIDIFEGNHTSILFNKKMYEQIIIDFKI